MTLLHIEDLEVSYKTMGGEVKILDGVNLDVDKGEIVGVVGESGSGKSTLGHSIVRLLPYNARLKGKILVDGFDVVKANEKQMYFLRGTSMFMIFQNPLNSLNPVKTVGHQLIETSLIRHQKEGKKIDNDEAYKESLGALKDLRLPDPENIMKRYPHQLSGGQIQRIVIAMSMLLKPKILIADEPTSALDVTVQAQVVKLLKQLNTEIGVSIIFITHDIALSYAISSRILVLYGGQVMEDGPSEDVIKVPLHPYSQGLISSIPSINKREGKLKAIPGNPPSFTDLPKGCRFSRGARR
nr:ABC transporter ATP-binding protein [Sulfuracidifex tepidarius]